MRVRSEEEMRHYTAQYVKIHGHLVFKTAFDMKANGVDPVGVFITPAALDGPMRPVALELLSDQGPPGEIEVVLSMADLNHVVKAFAVLGKGISDYLHKALMALRNNELGIPVITLFEQQAFPTSAIIDGPAKEQPTKILERKIMLPRVEPTDEERKTLPLA